MNILCTLSDTETVCVPVLSDVLWSFDASYEAVLISPEYVVYRLWQDWPTLQSCSIQEARLEILLRINAVAHAEGIWCCYYQLAFQTETKCG